MTFFERVNEKHIFSRMEVGYAWMNYFFKNLFDSYALMQFIEVFFCTSILFIFCKLYSPCPFLSLFVYASIFFYSYNMGLTRQFIALSISLITVMAFFKGKKIRALLCIIIASLFHKSAVITILYIICYKIKVKKLHLIVLVFLSILFNLFGEKIILNIVNAFFSLPIFSSFFGKYATYLTNAIWSAKGEYSSGLGFLLRMSLILSVYFLKKNNTVYTNFIFNAVVLDLFIGAMGRNLAIMGRLTKYFELYEIILFAYLFDFLRQKAALYLRPIVFLPLLLYFFVTPVKFTRSISTVDGKSQWDMFDPWNSIFFPIENTERNTRMKIINAF